MNSQSGKRKLWAVLLGTEPSQGFSTSFRNSAPQEACSCVVCVNRKPHTPEMKWAALAEGKALHMCKIRCGGTKEAGDGKLTTCKTRGRITTCQYCCKEIKPVWKMAPEQRAEKLEAGMSMEQLLEENKLLLAVLKAEEAELAEGE